MITETREAMEELGKRLDVVLRPHVELLEWTARWLGVLLVIAAVVLAGVFVALIRF